MLAFIPSEVMYIPVTTVRSGNERVKLLATFFMVHARHCRAFDIHQKHMLMFHDYLLGLAAMEPCTQHGGAPAELRCRYIFRYYDQDGDSQLEMSEFR